MEWLLALLCMVPAAISDAKYRTVSLESCVAAFVVGCAVFVMHALTGSVQEVVTGGIMGGSVSGVAFAFRRMMGSGDWWFVAGISMAICTIHPMAVVYCIVGGMVPLMCSHVILCVRRPGLGFPLRLYRYQKREGDRFCVDPATGRMDSVPAGAIVYPGLPMVTSIVFAGIVVGLLL